MFVKANVPTTCLFIYLFFLVYCSLALQKVQCENGSPHGGKKYTILPFFLTRQQNYQSLCLVSINVPHQTC